MILKLGDKLKFIFLLSLLFAKPVFSKEFVCMDGSKPNREVNNGVEMIICGFISKPDAKLGHVALPNATSQFTRIDNGKFIYTKKYTTDHNGMRTSSSAHQPQKKKHFLYIDGSVAFGEGLNDDETTTHWINLKSKNYEAYSIGYQGYQDTHNWLQFEKADLPKKIKHKKGRALLISYDYKINLLAAELRTLTSIVNTPHIKEDKKGNFKFLGSFRETTSYFNKFLISFCFPVPACKNFIFTYPPSTDSEKLDADAARLARLYSSIDKFYRDQFDVEEFTVGWIGTKEGLLRMQKHLTIPIVSMPSVEKYPDGHPSPVGAKKWADFILATLLKN